MLQVCEELGVPLASEKVEGTASCLVFLGIELECYADLFTWSKIDEGKAISQPVARTIESVHEVGAAIPSWCVTACQQDGPPRLHISETPYRNYGDS